MIENQTCKKIKIIRTDNGLESCIQRHKAVPYMLQQNDVVERMNRILLERVRCMLASYGLSKRLWGEAVCTVAFLINRSPSVPLNGKCPESVWSGTQIVGPFERGCRS